MNNEYTTKHSINAMKEKLFPYHTKLLYGKMIKLMKIDSGK